MEDQVNARRSYIHQPPLLTVWMLGPELTACKQPMELFWSCLCSIRGMQGSHSTTPTSAPPLLKLLLPGMSVHLCLGDPHHILNAWSKCLLLSILLDVCSCNSSCYCSRCIFFMIFIFF